MEQHTRKPDGSPADEVLTNAEWLRLTGELLDADLTLLASTATDVVSVHCLAVLLDLVYKAHADEVCAQCRERLKDLECYNRLSPDNPACENRWCSQATLYWLNSPCADPDED